MCFYLTIGVTTRVAGTIIIGMYVLFVVISIIIINIIIIIINNIIIIIIISWLGLR